MKVGITKEDFHWDTCFAVSDWYLSKWIWSGSSIVKKLSDDTIISRCIENDGQCSRNSPLSSKGSMSLQSGSPGTIAATSSNLATRTRLFLNIIVLVIL